MIGDANDTDTRDKLSKLLKENFLVVAGAYHNPNFDSNRSNPDIHVNFLLL